MLSLSPQVALLEGNTALYAAAWAGHHAVVEKLLSANPPPDANKLDSSTGQTPLYAAAKSGHVATVRRLIAAAGIMLDKARGVDNATPLYVAARFGRQQTVEVLLAAGAEPNKDAGARGRPLALWAAAAAGDTAIVKLLLEHGASTEARAESGATALFAAATGGHESAVRALLEWGAATDAALRSTMLTPLGAAVKHNYPRVMEVLLEYGSSPNVVFAGGEHPMLSTAAIAGNSYTIKLLIGAGADPTVTGVDNLTPLHYAASAGNVEVVQVRCSFLLFALFFCLLIYSFVCSDASNLLFGRAGAG